MDEFQAAKDGFSVPPGRGFQATEPDSIVQGNLNLFGVQVVDSDTVRNRLVLPALGRVQPLSRCLVKYRPGPRQWRFKKGR